MSPLEEIEHIADVPMQVEVLLDKRWSKMSEILALEEGSVIEMDRSAGENIDIYIGGRLIGFGEIVIIESILGVRITDFNLER